MSVAAVATEGNAERVPLLAACGVLPYVERYGWVLDWLDELRLDVAVFLHADVEALDAATFFAFAEYAIHYRGAVRGRAEREQAERDEDSERRYGTRRGATEPVQLSDTAFLARMEADPMGPTS